MTFIAQQTIPNYSLNIEGNMMKKTKNCHSLSFTTLSINTLLISLMLSITQAMAAIPSHYQQLRFTSTFYSDYASYPDSDNTQTGTALIYQQAGSSAKKVRFSPSPHHVQQAVLASTTANPFKRLYPALYTTRNRERLIQCPMLSLPFELDNNPQTQEWLVSMSSHFCLNPSSQGEDHDAHMWILQRQANYRYRILMEGDHLIVVTNNQQQGYKTIESSLYLKRSQTNQQPCGGAVNTWMYRQGRYQLQKTDYHARDCNYQHARGEMMDRYQQRFINAAKPQVDAVMQTFR